MVAVLSEKSNAVTNGLTHRRLRVRGDLLMNPFTLFLISLAGWMSRIRQDVIQHLQEEIPVLKEQLGKRPWFTDDQRRRLALQGKRIGRRPALRPAVSDRLPTVTATVIDST